MNARLYLVSRISERSANGRGAAMRLGDNTTSQHNVVSSYDSPGVRRLCRLRQNSQQIAPAITTISPTATQPKMPANVLFATAAIIVCLAAIAVQIDDVPSPKMRKTAPRSGWSIRASPSRMAIEPTVTPTNPSASASEGDSPFFSAMSTAPTIAMAVTTTRPLCTPTRNHRFPRSCWCSLSLLVAGW